MQLLAVSNVRVATVVPVIWRRAAHPGLGAHVPLHGFRTEAFAELSPQVCTTVGLLCLLVSRKIRSFLHAQNEAQICCYHDELHRLHRFLSPALCSSYSMTQFLSTTYQGASGKHRDCCSHRPAFNDAARLLRLGHIPFKS